ncbi:GIY-YIG nuclease superfamily protein [compost metagenome]
MERYPFVYILASKRNGTLYIGVTADLVRRAWEHRTNAAEGFSQRYGVHQLVYYEQHVSMLEAIAREKRLKKWRREWKIDLIESFNPDWQDLWPSIL